MNSRRFFSFGLWLLLAGAGASSANAQNWSDQLFESRSHDFGYVARNSKLKKEFVVKNTLNRRLHIARATPSCSVCTIAKPEKEWLEPGESTVLKATIDTLTVIGSKDVSITVEFDSPSYAQTRLTLRCYSRPDIVFDPGEFWLGTVKRGTPTTKTMNIAYAGSIDWKIDGATASNPYIETELAETRRESGRVDYRLKVTLKPDAPPGPIRDRILLGVNDAYNKSGIEVALQGNIQADVSLSTSTLDIGTVAPGSTTTKQVLVRGVKPFKIVSIEGPEGPIQIEKPEDSKQLHILTVTLKAGTEPGELTQDFQIKTDMENEAPLKLTVSAKLAKAKPSPAPSAN